jgi:uncharacterized protein YktB (UPF0637 family)
MGLSEEINLKKIAKKNLVENLRTAETLQDFFDICKKHFDTENTKLGLVTKLTLTNNIDKLLDVSGAKPRKK